MNGPPRPALVIRVGVTGHRPDKLTDADPQELRDRVSQLLRTVQQVAHDIGADRSAGYSEAAPVLRVVSSLAEGADRLVADAALAMGFELQAVLPYAAAVYAQEFADDNSRAEFGHLLARAGAVLVLDGEPRQGEAYEGAGLAVLHQSDVLIAVWDGEDAAGRGGTADIVRKAAQQEILVAWVRARSPLEAALLTAEGDDLTAHPIEELGPQLARLLRPPPLVQPRGGHGRPVADLRERFLAESPVRGRLGHIYGILTNLLTRPSKAWPHLLPRDYVAATRAAWRASWAGIPDSLGHALEATLLAPYAWADRLATYYANRYRSAFTWTYLLAPLAVLAALGAEFDEAPRKTYWAIANVAVLICLLGLYWVGRRRLWHERWLDYRSLAEQLRHLTVLLPLGHANPALRVPAHQAAGDPRATWVHWYLRAVARQSGVFPAVMDRPYLAACRRLLRTELEQQVEYHATLATRMHSVHARLHRVVVILFVGALAAGGLKLIHGFPLVVTPLAAMLAALGGATHGFLSQGDFQSLARRSTGVRAGLQRLAARLDRLPAPSTRALGDLAEATADVMSGELIDWRVEVGEKPLTLPHTH